MRTTPGQKEQLRDQLGRAINDSGLDRDGLQRVIGRGGEFISGAVDLLRRLGNPENPFASEVVNQVWFYPRGWKPDALEVQAKNIAAGLSGFEPKWREDVSGLMVPNTADGICILPTLKALGKHWSIDAYRAIGECIEATYTAVAALRPTTNYRRGELTSRYVRLPESWLGVVEPLEREVENRGENCFVLPFHFGDWKTGECYSQRNAIWQALNLPPRRFPLCAVQVGTSLIAMPGRLTAWEQLFIDCCDQYDWGAAGDWASSLCVRFGDGRLRLRARGAIYAGDSGGLPVAFLRES